MKPEVSAIVARMRARYAWRQRRRPAKYNIPHLVDVGVADQIVERGLKNTFRFGPGYKVITEAAINDLHIMNTLARKPAKTVMVVHEEIAVRQPVRQSSREPAPGNGLSRAGGGQARQPTRDFNNIVLR